MVVVAYVDAVSQKTKMQQMITQTEKTCKKLFQKHTSIHFGSEGMTIVNCNVELTARNHWQDCEDECYVQCLWEGVFHETLHYLNIIDRSYMAATCRAAPRVDTEVKEAMVRTTLDIMFKHRGLLRVGFCLMLCAICFVLCNACPLLCVS